MTSNKPVITGICLNPEMPGKRDLYLNGEFFMSIPFSLLLEQDLEVGMPFGEEEIEALTLAAQLIPAKEKAFEYLGYGDLSHKKLYEKLLRFGIEPAPAEAACAYMEERGFINDRRLAEKLTLRFAEGKHWGARRILPELIQKGIPAELAKEAVENLDFDYNESIQWYLKTKYRRYDPSDPKMRQRIVQGLLRYGFGFDEINRALSTFEDDYD